MIVLDAYAVLALLKGEPAGRLVEELLAPQHEARLTALGVAEVVDHLVRLCGASEDGAPLDLAQLGLADAETARTYDAPVASADPHLLEVCPDEGIGVIPLPDTAGRTWLP